MIKNGGVILRNRLEKIFEVGKNNTAAKIGSGSLDILSTPSLISFMENTALSLVADDLEEGETTVGIEMNMQHRAPSGIGEKIQVEANLVEQKKTILSFEIEAWNKEGITIATGEHKRAIVNASTFMENI